MLGAAAPSHGMVFCIKDAKPPPFVRQDGAKNRNWGFCHKVPRVPTQGFFALTYTH